MCPNGARYIYPWKVAVPAEFPSDKSSFHFIQIFKSFEDNLSGFWVSKEVELSSGRNVADAIFVSSHDNNIFYVVLKVFV